MPLLVQGCELLLARIEAVPVGLSVPEAPGALGDNALTMAYTLLADVIHSKVLIDHQATDWVLVAHL